MLDLRLGIDVGGTNTDAVILDRDDRLLAKAKIPSTVDVTGGIERVVDSVLDSETADAILTETIRYGQRVTVIAFACDPVWRTERGIAVAGPRAFDYDFDYLPVEELARARA